MEALRAMKCVACRRDAPRVTEAEIVEYHPQVSEWELIERDEIKRLECLFQFDGFAQALSVHKPCGRTGGGGRASSRSLDRMGKGNCHMVDTQNQWGCIGTTSSWQPKRMRCMWNEGEKNEWYSSFA